MRRRPLPSPPQTPDGLTWLSSVYVKRSGERVSASLLVPERVAHLKAKYVMETITPHEAFELKQHAIKMKARVEKLLGEELLKVVL